MALAARIQTRPILGMDVDPQGRCRHWNGQDDIVAIRSPCCDGFYACYDCHVTLTGHAPRRWPEGSSESAVACGACDRQIPVDRYIRAHERCPSCKAPFNPGCLRHHHLYFETAPEPL